MNSLKLIATDAGDAVMARQPLVQKREIGVEEIENAAVFLDDGFKEQFGLLEHGGAKSFVKAREKLRIRRSVFQAAQFQPLPGKIRDQGVRFAILEHAPHLCIQNRLFMQLALPGLLEKLVIGHAAPQEVGEPASQLKII